MSSPAGDERQEERPGMSRRTIALAALVALTALTVLLVLTSLGGSGEEESSAPAKPSASSSQPQPSGDGTEGATEDGATGAASPTHTTPGAIPPPAPVAQNIFGVSSTTAWRYAVGTCAAGGASLERSADGGRSWTPAKGLPLKVVTRVNATDTKVTVVGADAACKPVQVVSTDNGTTWQSPTPVTGVWAPAPSGALLTPTGGPAKPCRGGQIVQFVRLSATGGQALCESGAIVQSMDGGTTWKTIQTLPGALSMDAVQQPIGVVTQAVIRGTGTCKGLQVVQAEGAGQASPLGCVAVDVTSVKPGAVALSSLTKGGWLRVGPQTFVSADMATWKPAR